MTHSMMINSKIYCSGLLDMFLNLRSETALLATERLYWYKLSKKKLRKHVQSPFRHVDLTQKLQSHFCSCSSTFSAFSSAKISAKLHLCIFKKSFDKAREATHFVKLKLVVSVKLAFLLFERSFSSGI